MEHSRRNARGTVVAAVGVCGLLLAATGCSTWDKLNDTERGAVIGGGTGAVVGNAVSGDTAGTVVGGALGAVGGGLIGHEMDERDRDRDEDRYRRY